MSSQTIQQSARPDQLRWLQTYYFIRAGVTVVWIAAALTIGARVPPIATALLLAYPAWDAIANIGDAQRSGGLMNNPSQALNAAISIITTIAVFIAFASGPHAVIAVFGVWAMLSGLAQLVTGIRRWNAGGQWAMILSGLQSTLAGTFFIKLATGTGHPGITDIVPYAAFGAFYFLVSALWLTVRSARQQ
jgi:hypothetical protein